MPIKSVLGLFILVTFLVSCNQQEKVEANINKYENAVLASSQEITKRQIVNDMNVIREKLKEEQSHDLALVNKPKADSAIALANNTNDYLHNLQNKINNNETLGDNDSLFEELKTYEDRVMKIDTFFFEYLGDTILYIDTFRSFKNMDRNQFNNQFLKRSSKRECITFLNALKENILIVEANMVHYFALKCDMIVDRWDEFESIISQNSKHFKPNEELEITAGIGAFSVAARPTFIMNEKNIEIDDEGVAKYKMRVSKEKGKHIVPVKISYIKHNGEKQVEVFEVVYYVE